jgi:hypothetical protein
MNNENLTVPKWVLINRQKIPQMLQNVSVQFVCPIPKVLDFNEKRLYWASVVLFCVNGMEPIWTLPSRFGLGITLIYVDWLHYYVHCAHPTLRCEAALIRAAAAASSMSMPLCFGVPKRPPRTPAARASTRKP